MERSNRKAEKEVDVSLGLLFFRLSRICPKLKSTVSGRGFSKQWTLIESKENALSLLITLRFKFYVALLSLHRFILFLHNVMLPINSVIFLLDYLVRYSISSVVESKLSSITK